MYFFYTSFFKNKMNKNRSLHKSEFWACFWHSFWAGICNFHQEIKTISMLFLLLHNFGQLYLDILASYICFDILFEICPWMNAWAELEIPCCYMYTWAELNSKCLAIIEVVNIFPKYILGISWGSLV